MNKHDPGQAVQFGQELQNAFDLQHDTLPANVERLMLHRSHVPDPEFKPKDEKVAHVPDAAVLNDFRPR